MLLYFSGTVSSIDHNSSNCGGSSSNTYKKFNNETIVEQDGEGDQQLNTLKTILLSI